MQISILLSISFKKLLSTNIFLENHQRYILENQIKYTSYEIDEKSYKLEPFKITFVMTMQILTLLYLIIHQFFQIY